MSANLQIFDELEWMPELEDEWESYGGAATDESDLVRSQIAKGNTNENSLSDLVFFKRHPERNGAAISRSESNFQSLSKEWLNIRDTIVRPLLQQRNSPPVSTPGTSPGSTPPASGSVAARILAEAQKWVGFREGPNNENPFSAYFKAPNVAWCAYFVSYVYTKGGMPLSIGSSDAMLEYLRTRGQFIPNTSAPQPVDIVIFDWTVSDHDPAEHVGLVEKVYRNSSGQTRVGTIEGNTSDGVNRRDYGLGDARIVGFGRLISTPASRAPAGRAPTTGGSTGGTLDLVTLSWNGRTFQVARRIAAQVQALLEAAAGDGIQLLVNSAYRDPAQQIALRKKNCGSTHYDIYQKPSSQCTPPTAIPGKSNHEKGLAIDFGVSGGKLQRGTPAFEWLSRNAEQYFGLKNFPKEPWHWSVDGN